MVCILIVGIIQIVNHWLQCVFVLSAEVKFYFLLWTVKIGWYCWSEFMNRLLNVVLFVLVLIMATVHQFHKISQLLFVLTADLNLLYVFFMDFFLLAQVYQLF